jgi:hypothetical protein
LLVFATPVTNYANYDAGFSHIYSLFAITAFIYFVKSWFSGNNKNHFLIACTFFGLIIILRPINVLIMLFVPFLAGSIAAMKEGLIRLLRKPKIFLTGLFIFVCICFIQCLAWYFQTGKFIIYSYVGEGFNFSQPQIINILFSYRKGLFVYSPVLFISMLSLLWFGYKRRFYNLYTWLSFFIILTYVISSWHNWGYGASFGMRAFIEYFPVFFIIFALMLNEIKPLFGKAIIVISLLTIPLNVIQTYQYKSFILSWYQMDRDKYWKVFLRTSKQYIGLIWKKQYDYNNYSVISESVIGDLNVSESIDTLIYKSHSRDIPGFDAVALVQVSIDNEFNRNDASRLILMIHNLSGTQYYCYLNPYLLQFSEKCLNEWQTGLYNYEIPMIKDTEDKIIALELKTRYMDVILKNVRIKYLKNR